jgi:hypothetical protein
LKSVIGLSLIFIISGFTYAYIDPTEMRNFGIFPWDSGIYRKMAGVLVEGEFSRLEGHYPFAQRLLFPAVYGALADYFAISFINPAYIVNMNRPGVRGGWLVLIMRLLSISADYVRRVPQTRLAGYTRWAQGVVFG